MNKLDCRKSNVEECIFDYMASHIEYRFNKNSLLQCYFVAILPAGHISKGKFCASFLVWHSSYLYQKYSSLKSRYRIRPKELLSCNLIGCGKFTAQSAWALSSILIALESSNILNLQVQRFLRKSKIAVVKKDYLPAIILVFHAEKRSHRTSLTGLIIKERAQPAFEVHYWGTYYK